MITYEVFRLDEPETVLMEVMACNLYGAFRVASRVYDVPSSAYSETLLTLASEQGLLGLRRINGVSHNHGVLNVCRGRGGKLIKTVNP